MNFGGIGVVIGHEMTHGFDDQGSKYDGKGNLRDWWTPADHKAFDARTECIANEYSGFEAAPAQGNTPAAYLNGHLTLGENTADNGGLRIAYMALDDTLAARRQDPWTRKSTATLRRSAISSASPRSWCENDTEAAARQSVLVDPHSPGHWRVNGSGAELRRIRQGLWLQEGSAHVSRESCRVW